VTAWYNENNLAAAHILRQQIEDGVIAPGIVDTRSIKDVQPDDLIGFTQCHFFAGGGLWSVAARLAGWPDHEPIWTGSCPCQPFSAAGKGAGTDDPRHLWPDLHRLTRARRPPVLMGEQVAGAAGYGWFDGVRADLENEGFAARTIDFPACSVDAPHQRNRQYWCALDLVYAEGVGWGEGRPEPELRSWWPTPAGADASGRILSSHASFSVVQGQPSARDKQDAGEDEGVHADAGSQPRQQIARSAFGYEGTHGRRPQGNHGHPSHDESHRRNGTYWSDAEWIECHDDKARRAKSGLRFLVDGLPGRVDLWRVGGNAIVPEAAKEVIAAFIDVYGLPSQWRAAA